MNSGIFSNVRRRTHAERAAAKVVAVPQPSKPRHWRKGILSNQERLEAHGSTWDGRGSLVSFPRLRLGRKVGR